jgi:succinate dehydrogenase / fumarate reductase cytochrome b subunit
LDAGVLTVVFVAVLTNTTVGRKALMAVTGIVLLGYVTVHMLGNLKAFFGPGSLDGYGRWLREILEPVFGHAGILWLVRAVLVASVALHIITATQLARQAHAARPVAYRHRTRIQGGYAARTMRWGGVIIALFVVYHILDLTTGTLNPHGVQGEIYRNVTADFRHWYVILVYTVAVLALGFHVRHGIWSAARSLGFTAIGHPLALGYATMITAGFLAVPYAVLFGVIR